MGSTLQVALMDPLNPQATRKVADAFPGATCYVGKPFNDAALTIGRRQAQQVSSACNARVTFLAPASEKKEAEAPAAKLYTFPKAAIVAHEGGKAVLVVSEGTVKVRPVTIAREVGGDAYVSNGLSGSESVILGENLNQLKAGDRVEVGQ